MKKILPIVSILLFINLLAVEAPIGLSTSDYFQLTNKEQTAYVSAVLDGEIFLLYGSNSPNYKSLNQCIKKEGVDKIVQFVDVIYGFAEELDSPVPWAIAKSVGVVCKDYK